MPPGYDGETKGDVLGKEAKLRLGLMQDAPLSPILFLVYISDLHQFCRRQTNFEVLEESLGKAEVKLTVDDVAIHTKDWGAMQT